MTIAIHDYCGHPFQIELSRALASRGHNVTHLYCDSNPTTPKGRLARSSQDPANLTIQAIGLPKDIEKRRFFDRWKLDRLYGIALRDAVLRTKAEIVVSANTPLDSLVPLQDACRSEQIAFIYWAQDLIGEAISGVMKQKLHFLGSAIGAYYQAKERKLLRASDLAIAITDDFVPYLRQAGLSDSKISTIPNWAPLDETRPGAKDNRWARKFGLEQKFVFLYSGTLGFKHNPGLFLALASQMRKQELVRIVVNSQGDAAQWLSEEVKRLGVTNLIVNPFQPYEEMSDVLATSDVLVAILEADAGKYSVPSKVLSYHCASRPILLAVPEVNLAARIVREQCTGLVVDPKDQAGFCSAAQELYENANLRIEMASRGRRYAEANFNAQRITTRFEDHFRKLIH